MVAPQERVMEENTKWKPQYIFWRLYLFREVLVSLENWEENNRFLHILPALTCIASPIINIPHLNGAFVTTDETTLPHHNHPKSIVYILVTLSSQYLSWFHFVCRILLFLQYLIDIQCGRELHFCFKWILYNFSKLHLFNLHSMVHCSEHHWLSGLSHSV